MRNKWETFTLQTNERPLRCSRVRLFFGFVLLASSALALSPDWRPISPEDLARKQSAIDSNADAEILFKDVRINKLTMTTYLRYKIFNQRGRDTYANVKLEYAGKTRISHVSARTIHPDGQIFDLNPQDVFDKVEAKAKGYKAKVIAFALPAVEPGSLIEYRWSEDALDSYAFLTVQEGVPVLEATYHLKPAFDADMRVKMRYISFNCQPEKSSPDPHFTTLTVRNVQAYREEPHSPPLLAAKQWILAYYEYIPYPFWISYWDDIAKAQYEAVAERTKVNGEIKQLAAQIAVGANDEEKLAAIVTYCRKNIANVADEDATLEERETFKSNKSAAETLRRGTGTPRDIHLAFIALAKAAGYDARLARLAARRSFLFVPQNEALCFLDTFDAAVLLNGKWRFYEVSDASVAIGSLSWQEQGVYALLPGPDRATWIRTPMHTPEQSKIERLADLRLSSEGDLEGDIREIYWVNQSSSWRQAHAHETAGEREEFVCRQVRDRLPDVEVSAIHVQVSPDPKRPVGIQYRIAIPHYAQRTGKRLFVHLSFFTSGARPYFTDTERKNAIYFEYPWSEEDRVSIRLPDGFQLDHPQGPSSLTFSTAGGYIASINFDKATNTATYGRSFVFGADSKLLFDRDAYKSLKVIFDQVSSNDDQLLTLMQAAVAATN